MINSFSKIMTSFRIPRYLAQKNVIKNHIKIRRIKLYLRSYQKGENPMLHTAYEVYITKYRK